MDMKVGREDEVPCLKGVHGPSGKLQYLRRQIYSTWNDYASWYSEEKDGVLRLMLC